MSEAESSLHDWALVNDAADVVESVCSHHSAFNDHSAQAQEEFEQREGQEAAVGSEPKKLDESAMPEPAQEQDGSDDTTPTTSGIRIRLRTGETICDTVLNLNDTVQQFIDTNFSEDKRRSKKIRLIYMGMLLQYETQFREYNIAENGVIHCVVTDAPPSPSPSLSPSQNSHGFTDPATPLLFLTGLMLYGIWTLLYHFPEYFSWKSAIMLCGLSLMHLAATVSRFTS